MPIGVTGIQRVLKECQFALLSGLSIESGPKSQGFNPMQVTRIQLALKVYQFTLLSVLAIENGPRTEDLSLNLSLTFYDYPS